MQAMLAWGSNMKFFLPIFVAFVLTVNGCTSPIIPGPQVTIDSAHLAADGKTKLTTKVGRTVTLAVSYKITLARDVTNLSCTANWGYLTAVPVPLTPSSAPSYTAKAGRTFGGSVSMEVQWPQQAEVEIVSTIFCDGSWVQTNSVRVSVLP
jgi:hypothetical protein